ncbi:MAG: sporulation protein YunB [Oscillospiraceae bacterium]|nr:sporulation protein YunB [Oscillospiraceae bacterium]
MKKRFRPRTRREKKIRLAVKIGIALCLIALFFIFVSVRLRPIMQSVTSNIAKQMMVSSINQVVLKELEEKNYQYDDFVNVVRDSDGTIQTISLNMVNVNTLKSNISLTIQQELGDSQQQTGVPIGTLLGVDLLRGHGPRIPLRISVLGNSTVDLKSTFDSAGINQTRHQIYLDITTAVYSYLTGVSATTDVTTAIPVAETVIVGEVPQMYANLSQNSDWERLSQQTVSGAPTA